MKKKAFTLIELLAVIVILAIILGITIVSMTGVLKGAKSNSFEATQKALKIAAKTFISEHSDQCVQNVDDVYICTSDLIKDNYINKINNIEGSNDECIGYVKAIKGNSALNEDYYILKTYLKCGENEYTDGLNENYNEIINYCNATQENRHCTKEMQIFLTPNLQINQTKVAVSKIVTITYPMGSYTYEYSFNGSNWETSISNIIRIEFKSNGTLFVRIKSGETVLNGMTYDVTRVDSRPIGTIVPYAGTSIPEGYLLADGSAKSRTEYAKLYNIIETTYGSGNGSTTFTLPNLKGKAIVGRNTSDTDFDVLGKTGGSKTETITTSQLPSHTHTFTGSSVTTTTTGSSHYHSAGLTLTTWPLTGSQSGRGSYQGWDNSHGYYMNRIDETTVGGSHTHTYVASGTNSAVGSGSSHNNLQPYTVLKYLIKYQ